MPPECSHRPPCPGCPRFGEESPSPDAVARLRQFCAHAGAPEPTLVSASGFGSRHRARLMVRGRARSPKIGIFQAGTHDIVDIPRCSLHHPLINEVAAAAKRAIRQTGIAPYSDRHHRGLVRALQVVVQRGNNETAQVVVVGNSATPEPFVNFFDAFISQIEPKLNGLWWNGQPEQTNTILGPLWERISGPVATREVLPGATIFYPPGAFGQANAPMGEEMIRAIHAMVPAGSVVAEFYAGVGAIGLGLLGLAEEVRFNEIGPGSLAGLRMGLEEATGSGRNTDKASIHEGAAEDALHILEGANVAIVDPPRKGLGAVVTEALGAWQGERLIYLSCGLDSFLHEAETLHAAGWKVSGVTAFNAFPFTNHLETLALFTR